MVNTAMETNLAITLLSRLYKFRLPGVRKSPCKPIEILIINESITLIISKQKLLQLKSVLLHQTRESDPHFCGRA